MVSYVAYTNRKGQTFYLHKRPARTGRTCYVFMKQPSEGPVSEIPEGYEIVEGVNGNVSLRKIKPRPISDLELQTVRRLLDKDPHLHLCRVAAKGKTIEVYEPRKGSLFESHFGKNSFLGWGADWTTERVCEYNLRHADYTPTMRFVLVDRTSRQFRIERMCYRSWHDGWLSLDRTGSLEQLAEEFLPHLSRESFYDLWPY